MSSTPKQPDSTPKAVSVAAKEVTVTGENVTVEGQNDTTKKKELEAVAGLASTAVNLEDAKRAIAIEEVAKLAKELRQEDAVERKDIREKEFKKTILAIIIAALVPTMAAAGTLIITYRDSKVIHSTHRLVNSGSLVQLRTNLRSARTIFKLTQDPEDERDVRDAEKLVEEHLAKQKLADEESR